MKKTDGRRLVAALRAAPRTLREDLWTAPADPLPPVGAPGYPVWRPVFGVLLVLAAAMITVLNVDELTPPDAGITGYAVLLAVLQSAVLVAGMSRPLPAWWASTILMVVIVRLGEPVMSPDTLFPWTISGICLQGGALFLLSLRVHPRRAAEALAISLLAGVACTTFTTQPHNLDVDRAVPVLVAAVVLGAALRGIRVARTALVVQEELTTEERARRTLLEERNRIARELHDVVAHHMSVISIQAQVAPHLVDNPSDALKENLAGIRENAVGALTELRRVLGYCAPRTPRRKRYGTLRSPRSTGWTSWSAMCTAQGSPSPYGPPARRAHCRPASSCRRSASCRRRSAT